MIYAENILICIAVPLLIILVFLAGRTRLFTASFLLGMFVCLIAAYISGYVTIISEVTTDNVQIFISPVIEELMKFMPLLLYLMLIEPEDENLFTACLGIGAGFATFENCCYILSFGAGSLPFILVRGLAVGIMHIVSVLTLTSGLVLARRYRALTIAALLGAVSLSMIFHGLYNLLVSEPGASSYIGYILPVVTAICLYFLYRRINHTDESLF